ncbi:SDR family oxidoreductase [Paraburkholderia sp. BL21I4N1]|uniref:SDR family oxidoreductase n=1 Tax=Paraburkholderia sp. BL21I4N1 TaxID=1938801 RepID=UPI000CFC48C3|nr:SDR family oxidoreductase [Paraburkholderia sp. BL21I4N1]
MRRAFESQTVLKPLGRPEDIAAAAAFLAPDAAAFMAGNDLVIDEGWTPRGSQKRAWSYSPPIEHTTLLSLTTTLPKWA